jgi:membrane fusion protein (multidrug efflux system)
MPAAAISDSPATFPKKETSDKAEPVTPTAAWSEHRRLIVGLFAAAALLAVAGPRVVHAWHTVSTDDAYVNDHVTFVAPRVMGQVARVLVDDNYRVNRGDVLAELDSEPYRVRLAIRQAAVDSAQAELVVTEANVRGQLGQARSARFKLERAIEDVDNNVALLRARVATLDETKAALVLAQAEFDRATRLLATKVISAEEFDKKHATRDVAQAQVQQALESAYQVRVALGLSRDPGPGGSLTDVPPDIDQTFSTVHETLAELFQVAAQIGIVPSRFDLSPKQAVEEFYRRDASGDINRIYEHIIKTAPALEKARTNLAEAQRDLAQAQLDLRYCTIVAEIDGVVTRRNVNPGNDLQVGQSIMAIRSLRDVWVDANFKETQVRNLRIGQRVDFKVDTYGSKRTFEGRISGFTMGTGSTLALLPAQNATGNFVKVVQRLPVRIDVVNYDPEQLPLFVGTSAEPEVDLNSTPTGPNAGQYLQDRDQAALAAKP